VRFDWEADFSSGSNLVDIPVSYTRQDVPPCAKTGVSLSIQGVRDAWSDDEIVDLRRDLVSLQNPFPDHVTRPKNDGDSDCLADPGFIFTLSVDGVESVGDPADNLDEHLLAAAWATLDGSVDEKGRAHYDLTVHRTKVKESLFDDDNDYKGLEGAHMRVYFMIYLAQYFQGAAIGVRQAQKIGREEAGVRIYLDGFRVFPYGEQGDDWLQLDYYAARNIDMGKEIAPPRATVELVDSLEGRPFLLIPKNQQLFGTVSLSQAAHSGVGINISRERLIETLTVVRLRRFVQNGIYWMTMRYAAHLAQQRAAAPKNKTKTVTEIIEDARTSIAAQADIPEQKRQEIVWNLNSAIDRARQDERDRISEISMLRVLASAGTTITLMNHQLQALIGAVQETEQDLVLLRPDIPSQVYGRYDDITAHVAEWRELVELQVSQLGFLLSPDSRQRRKQHALHEVVDNVGRPMSFYMRKYGIAFENKVPPNLRTPPMYLSELYAILINILSNALKFVYAKPERRIAVKAEKANGIMYLRMMDTGQEVPIERREVVFNAFESSSVPNPLLGVGTGLGLTVVRDILDLYGGSAHFIDVASPWKTCIEIKIPTER
jgi:signal transduction histidine kinase